MCGPSHYARTSALRRRGLDRGACTRPGAGTVRLAVIGRTPAHAACTTPETTSHHRSGVRVRSDRVNPAGAGALRCRRGSLPGQPTSSTGRARARSARPTGAWRRVPPHAQPRTPGLPRQGQVHVRDLLDRSRTVQLLEEHGESTWSCRGQVGAPGTTAASQELGPEAGEELDVRRLDVDSAESHGGIAHALTVRRLWTGTQKRCRRSARCRPRRSSAAHGTGGLTCRSGPRRRASARASDRTPDVQERGGPTRQPGSPTTARGGLPWRGGWLLVPVPAVGRPPSPGSTARPEASTGAAELLPRARSRP